MTYLQHRHNDSSAPEKVRQETTTTTISSTTTTTASSSMPLTSDSEPTMYNSAQKSLHYGGGRTNVGAKTNNINNSHLLEVDNGVGPRPLNGGRSSSHSSNSSVNNNPILNNKNSHNGLNGAKGAAYSSGHHSNGSNMSLPSGGGSGRATSAGGGAGERLRSGAYDQSDYSNGAHSWPILFAVIPPLGALIFGKSDIFSDMLTLILIAFFLYNIIKGNINCRFLFVELFGLD